MLLATRIRKYENKINGGNIRSINITMNTQKKLDEPIWIFIQFKQCRQHE